jgi:hypothetical protein
LYKEISGQQLTNKEIKQALDILNLISRQQMCIDTERSTTKSNQIHPNGHIASETLSIS